MPVGHTKAQIYVCNSFLLRVVFPLCYADLQGQVVWDRITKSVKESNYYITKECEMCCIELASEACSHEEVGQGEHLPLALT